MACVPACYYLGQLFIRPLSLFTPPLIIPNIENNLLLSLSCVVSTLESGGNFVPPTYFDYKELVIAAKWSKSAFFIQIFSHINRHRKIININLPGLPFVNESDLVNILITN